MVSIKHKKGGKKFYKKKTRSKRSRRKNRKINKTKRKRKRRRRRKSRKRYSYKGGMACVNRPAPSNIGYKYTGQKLNIKPVLPDPKNLNSNLRHSGQKGGGFTMQDFGLGDLLLNYYKGMNGLSNLKHTYKGNKHETKADPMHQPKLIEKQILPYSTANVPEFHSKASSHAAKFSIF